MMSRRQMAAAMAQLSDVTHDHPAPPFAAPLPPFDAGTHPAGFISFEGKIDRSGMVALERDAAAFGLRIEDPAALHRAFPRLPIPGTSRGILAGTLPGTGGTFGRLTWNTQRHPDSSAYLRRGAIVAARPGAPATPVGGEARVTLHYYSTGLAQPHVQVREGEEVVVCDLSNRAGLAELVVPPGTSRTLTLYPAPSCAPGPLTTQALARVTVKALPG